MKKISFLFIFLPTFLFSSLCDEIQVSINLDQSVFRLNSSVVVETKIKNIGKRERIIKLSPFNHESFYFVVKNFQNESLPLRDDYKIKSYELKSSSDMYKEITLSPGESVSRIVDLSEIYDFRESGFYYLKVFYYPDPDVKSEFCESEEYKILLKPPQIVEEEISKEEAQRKILMEKLKKLPPYDVVDDLLDAKMKKDWERFLFHFDLERLINSFQNFAFAYQNARTGKYKLEVLKDFRRYLTVHWQDRILSYEVRESYIKGSEATVDADVEYMVRNLSYVLRYTFKLSKDYEGVWKVYDYTVLRVK